VKLFVSPHNDDAVLFGAFTLMREHPLVLTVYDSYVQVTRGQPRCHWEIRRKEDRDAVCGVLHCNIIFGGVRDDDEFSRDRVGKVLGELKPTEVWLPALEDDGHEQHNVVALMGLKVFSGAKIHRYLTYTRPGGKSRTGKAEPANGQMVLKKLQALACYRTQIEIDELGCWPHFLRDQNEYCLD
jgi:LmbE family N-acetylglucosaminyl deacetylase